MLKLTLTLGRGHVYLWPKSFAISCDQYGNTDICLNGYNYAVTETPEEILAMPEMRAEIDRATLATLAAYPTLNIGSPMFPNYEVP